MCHSQKSLENRYKRKLLLFKDENKTAKTIDFCCSHRSLYQNTTSAQNTKSMAEAEAPSRMAEAEAPSRMAGNLGFSVSAGRVDDWYWAIKRPYSYG